MPKNLDLDVDHPDKIAAILRAAADTFYQASEDCKANWQDTNAGRPWTQAAKILERAAAQIANTVGDSTTTEGR